MPSVIEVLRRLDGAARARDLAGLCGRSHVRRAFAAGKIIRVAYGRYALPGCEDPWLAAARLSGVISHASAAEVLGLDLLSRPQAPQITIKRGRHHADPQGAELHWADLPTSDLDARGRITVARRTVLDCARLLPFPEALAIADSALRRGLVGQQELVGSAEAVPGAGRSRILRVARAADARAASVLESATRAVLLEAGFRFDLQVEIRDRDFFARVDLADRETRIVAEADSFEYHGHRAALVRDCARYDELTVRGWLVLRFAWEHVMFEPEWVAHVVRRAVVCRANSEGRSRARRAAGQRSGSCAL